MIITKKCYSPITSWQIAGGKVSTVTDFTFMGSKITADSDCNHEIKRHLLLGRKATTNLDSILKRRDISLLNQSILKEINHEHSLEGLMLKVKLQYFGHLM